MKKSIFSFLLLGGLAVFSGCALFVAGAAAGGYSVSEDTIEGLQNSGYDKTFSAVRAVLEKEGAVLAEDRTRGVIQASVDGREVEARVVRTTSRTAKLSIKARRAKGAFPDLDLAEQLYDKTVRRI